LAYLFGFLLALVSIAFLARPFLRRIQPTSESSSSLDSLKDVQWQHQQVYDGIKTLILDYDLGNVPTDEYDKRLGNYRLQAANFLQQEDQFLHEMESLGDGMEDAVLALRMSWGTVNRVTTCVNCGGEMDINVALCPRCEFPNKAESAPTEEEAS
jgi:hypothetical protein